MKYYFLGLILLILFEISNVYFIMPMPGSQNFNSFNSIDFAYFLNSYRWIFRVLFILIAGYGLKPAFSKRKIISSIVLVLALIVGYLFSFKMTAEKMFLQPIDLKLETKENNNVPLNKLVVGVVHNGVSKAYPIQFIAYHHQVIDDLDDKKIMVTYCSVCRTGRVFEPLVNGKHDEFRLVGMDNFNAMFEDSKTKSWWRQVNGEAIVGDLKGVTLPEVFSQQTSLEKWFELYPNSLVMQADTNFNSAYQGLEKYDDGNLKSKLVGTDFNSWNKKSWVLGIEIDSISKAYDWNLLKEKRFIIDTINYKQIIVLLADDNKSFFAYEIDNFSQVNFEKDVITLDSISFDLNGVSNSVSLNKINAYQEFWHSWESFHKNTLVYKP